MGWEWVVFWNFDFCYVYEYKVFIFRFRVRQVKFVLNFVEVVDFSFYIVDSIVLEIVSVSLFEGDGICFLQWGDGGVVDMCVGGGDVFDEFGGFKELIWRLVLLGGDGILWVG